MSTTNDTCTRKDRRMQIIAGNPWPVSLINKRLQDLIKCNVRHLRSVQYILWALLSACKYLCLVRDIEIM